MPSKSARTLALCLVAALPGFAACGDEDSGEKDASTTDAAANDAGEATPDASAEDAGVADEAVTIAFKLQAGDSPVDCTSPFTVGGTEVSASDLRFFVSEVALLDADGNATPVVLDEQEDTAEERASQTKDVALLDFEDKTGSCSTNGTTKTNTSLVGRVKPGNYTGVAFSLGVPEDLNHLDQATANGPLAVTGMFWGWKLGYKFTGIDLRTAHATEDADAGAHGAAGAFLVHVGSMACTGGAKDGFTCDRPNRARIELADFDAAAHAVVLDLNELVHGLAVGESADDVPGCMSGVGDPECEAIFENLGLDAATGKPSATLTQRAFRVADL